MKKIIKNPGLVIHKRDYRDITFGDALRRVDLPKAYITKKLLPDYQNGVPKCFPANARVLTEDFSFKEISKIRKGEYVYTHAGRSKKVTETFKRKWQGYIYKIRVAGIYKELELTAEHPVLVLRNGKTKWIEAKDIIKETDKIAILAPLITKDKTIWSFEKDKEFLWLLGLYLAEGYFGKRKRGKRIIFGLNWKEQEIAEKIKKIIKRLFDYDVQIRKEKNHSLVVEVNNTQIAEIFKELGNEKCQTKKIDKRLLFLDPQLQLEIIKGWFDGDGHYRKDKDGDKLVGITTSRDLAWQIYLIAMRNKININLSKRKKRDNRKDVYVLTVNNNEILKIYSNLNIQRKEFKRKTWNNDYLFSQIISVKKEIYRGGHVYNLEVKDDNSYLVNSIVVHNCVAEAYSYLARKQDFKETGKDFALSADALYSWIKNFVDKNREYGTSLLSGAKAICSFGIPTEDVYPDDEERWKDRDDYFDPIHFTQEVIRSASIFKKKTYIRASGYGWGMVNPEETKQMIFQREAVVIGLRFDNNWFAGRKYPKPPTRPKYYHAVCLDSWKYINNNLFFRVVNSFESDPKKRLEENGRAFGWLRWDWWRPHIVGAYTTIDQPNVYPKTKMIRTIRAKGDIKVYAVINGHRYWIRQPKMFEDFKEEKIIGDWNDVQVLSKEEVEKYPLEKISFKDFLTNYLDK